MDWGVCCLFVSLCVWAFRTVAPVILISEEEKTAKEALGPVLQAYRDYRSQLSKMEAHPSAKFLLESLRPSRVLLFNRFTEFLENMDMETEGWPVRIFAKDKTSKRTLVVHESVLPIRYSLGSMGRWEASCEELMKEIETSVNVKPTLSRLSKCRFFVETFKGNLVGSYSKLSDLLRQGPTSVSPEDGRTIEVTVLVDSWQLEVEEETSVLLEENTEGADAEQAPDSEAQQPSCAKRKRVL